MYSTRGRMHLVLFRLLLCCLVETHGFSATRLLSHKNAHSSRLLSKPLERPSSSAEDQDDSESSTRSVTTLQHLSSDLDLAVQSRRKMVQRLGVHAFSAVLLNSSHPANAYDKTFPDELDASDGILLDERQRKIKRILEKSEATRRRQFSVVAGGGTTASIGAVLWGAALWLLSGSRSNPLVTPIANVFYDEEQEGWLKDRNEGLFASLPLPLFGVLLVVFLTIGFGADTIVTLLADGNPNTSLQLAGVSVIGGATLELGRIASGEKGQTRPESDREAQLEQEFCAFADQRLKAGGNCHRLDVVRAFRRYYAKYRQSDNNTEYPLTDIEIEQLLRSWSRPRDGVEMSSAGFYTGIQINQDADVFAKR